MGRKRRNNSWFFTEMEMAKNTLEYTLFLSPIQAITDGDEATWVQTALDRTLSRCHEVLFKNFNYKFFGGPPGGEKGKKVDSASFFYNSDLWGETLFIPSILDQCVLSAYDSMVQLSGNAYWKASDIFFLEEIGKCEYKEKLSEQEEASGEGKGEGDSLKQEEKRNEDEENLKPLELKLITSYLGMENLSDLEFMNDDHTISMKKEEFILRAAEREYIKAQFINPQKKAEIDAIQKYIKDKIDDSQVDTKDKIDVIWKYVKSKIDGTRDCIKGVHKVIAANEIKQLFPDYIFCLSKEKGILFSHLPLLFSLLRTNKQSLKNWLKMYNAEPDTDSSEIMNKDSWENLQKFQKHLFYKIPADENISVDDIYWYYKLESAFNVDLFNCIAQNIEKVRKEGRAYPSGLNDYSSLAFSASLPNVFTRNCFVQYAFECLLREDKLSQSPFITSKNQVDAFSYPAEEKFSLHIWHVLFENFCNFFSRVIIPAEEWYFLITLYKTAELSCGEELMSNKSNRKSREAAELRRETLVAEKLRKILKEYIAGHVKEIVNRAKIQEEENYRSENRAKMQEEENYIIPSKLVESSLITPKAKLKQPDIDICRLLTLSKQHLPSTPIQQLHPHVLFDIRDDSTKKGFEIAEDGAPLREAMYRCIIRKNPQNEKSD